MPIQFDCSCGRKLQAQEEQAGHRVKCPACGAEMTVPAGATAVQPAETSPSKPSPVQDDEPRRSAVRDEHEDDRPRRKSRREEVEDDDDRPRRRRRSRDDDDDRDRPAAKKRGKGATAVLIVACVAGALVVPCLIGVLLVSVQKVREAAARIQSSNNLKQLALAMQNYDDANGHLPQAIPDPQVKPATKLSWRVQVLPYVEEEVLWRQFHQDEPWDSPHNKLLLTTMPKVFQHPNHPEENAKGLTYYRVFTGKDTPFRPGKQASLRDSFPDGTSNTFLIVEAADPVPWTKPDELAYDPGQPLPKLGGHSSAGFNAAFADGSVRVIRSSVNEAMLRHAINPKEGHLLPGDW